MNFLHIIDLTQFLRYVLIGATITAIGYLSIFFAMFVVGLNPYFSNMLIYGIGLFFSYAAHRSYTFRSSGNKSWEMVKFLTVFIIAYSANLGVLHLLIKRGISPGMAQLLAGMAYVIASFILNRQFVYTTGLGKK